MTSLCLAPATGDRRLDQATGYAPALPLRDYQKEGVAKMADRKAFALLMAMRTGKSATLLADFGAKEKAGEVDDLLVVAPAGCYRTWVGEIEKHASADLRSRLRVHVWESGNKSQSYKKALQRFLGNPVGPRAFLVNVEALSVAKAGAREACEEFLAPKRSMMVVDEVTVIKNPQAIRTKYVNRVLAPRADYRRILSGLPTPRSPLDLYCEFEFLDPAILRQRSYFGFTQRYAIVRQTTFGGKLKRPANIVVGYRNEDELRRLIEPHSFRVEFRPDIPSTYTFREVELTIEQRRIYDDLKRSATAELAAMSHVTAPIVIVRLLRLHQVLCGHVVDEDGTEHSFPERRTPALMELLDDYAGKAIIWCSYDADVRKVAIAIENEYGAGSVARFWGGNAATRETEEVAFKTDPGCRFMVATPAAGGRGRTWDGANLVVYYSSTNNLEHRDQSEQRAQNVGKKVGVDYVDLIAPGTVDGLIIKALRDKIDMASVITGDNYRDWLI